MKIFSIILLLLSPIARASNKTIVIAHRGASGYLPEHTLESASLAHNMGADFIEPDLVLSKDEVVVILHDIHLESTTNVKSLFPNRKREDGHWYAIDFTLAELKSLYVHERTQKSSTKAVFPKRFPVHLNIFQIPTLDEFILLIHGLNKSRNKKIGIYPEIKNPFFIKK